MQPLSQGITSLQRSGIREVMDLAFQRPDVLRLEVGDPDFPTPAHIVAAAMEAAPRYTHYTPSRGLGEVREALAAKVTAFNGIPARATDVVVTAGGGHGLFSVYRGLMDPGDAVLIPDPGWPNYRTIAALCSVDTVSYPLPRESGFLPDLEQLDRLMTTTPRLKAVLVSSPSNPTGAVWPREVLQAVVDMCTRHDVYLISDECYEAIVFEREHVSPATLDRLGHTISLFTVSKTYAMTGWRLGYVNGPADVLDAVGKVVESSVSCASAISQKAAEAAVSGDQSCVAEMVAEYRSRRDLAMTLLKEEGIAAIVPHGAFYVMVSVPADDTLDFARRLVRDAGVAVAPGDSFGQGGRGMIRISLASHPETIREGIRRIAAFCRAEVPAM